MKYSHNCGSKYVSVMVPLNTGQSKQIMLKICDKSLCCYCQTNACVIMPDGKRVCVGECADCALSNWFSNSYGYLIPSNICMDEFLKNESKYTLTPTTWLSAYLDNSLTTQILYKYHEETEITRAMEILINLHDCLTSNKLNKYTKLNNDKEELSPHSTPTLSSLQIASPKLIGRVRKQIDIVEDMAELRIDEPKRKMRRV